MNLFAEYGQPNRRRWRRTLLLAVWAATLGALLFVALLRQPRPARAEPPAQEPAPAAAEAGVSLLLRARTPAQSGYVTSTEVVNGDVVTYSMRLKNDSGSTISGISVEAVLPTAGLDNIECVCEIIPISVTRANALGDIEVVQVPRELRYNLSGGLAGGTAITVTFRARVAGQAGGLSIENTALSFFTLNGGESSALSNKVTLAVVAAVPTQAVDRANAVSDKPSWFSSDQGGTLDLDWGDVDSDGDLDLALASTLGTNVYINDAGQMRLLWSDPEERLVYGVRWLDVDADGRPELVAVGSPNAQGGGDNYVFRFNEGTLQSPDRFQLAANGLFTTTTQLTRLESGQFDGDTLPDLLVSVNAISAQCPVLLLRNQGATLFRGPAECVSEAGTAALAAADVNGDGTLDTALGLFPNQIRLFLSESGVLSQTNASNVLLDAPGYFLPYDFSWGDMDADGDLDLAAAFPLQRQVRVYRNNLVPSGTLDFDLLQPALSTGVFLTPHAVEWGDIDRDGLLDLIVGDAFPTIYWNMSPQTPNTPFNSSNRAVIELEGKSTEIWAIRAIDQDGNGTLEISLANRSGSSLLLANYSPSLVGDLTPVVGSGAAGSVAWGDINNDSLNDLLLGSPANRNASRNFLNDNGEFTFQQAEIYYGDQIGMHVAALGDYDLALLSGTQKGRIDVTLVTPGDVRIFRNGEPATTITIPGLDGATAGVAVLGDADGDGDLDLAVTPTKPGATGAPVYLVVNALNETPSQYRVKTISAPIAGISSLAWGDLNGDHYLDLAVGSRSVANRVLVNNSSLNFTSVPLTATPGQSGSQCIQGDTRDVAWADVDADGDQDLAVAVGLGRSCMLENEGGVLRVDQLFGGNTTRATSLDWGDWDNDGDLDLAVGHDNQAVRVYANLQGRLIWLWGSTAPHRAAAVAWGDMDSDGDLDLGLAQTATSSDSGYFENRRVAPAHLLGAAEVNLLPDTGAYVFVRRPGVTRAAYDYSTSEILSGPGAPTVTVSYRLFDPDGEPGDPPQLYSLIHEFSLDGGGSWQKATAMPGQSSTINTTLTRTGANFEFRWNAIFDKAIGENARFRVQVVNPNAGNTLQAAGGVGISPPFQVRATTCVWPANPTIYINRVAAAEGVTFPLPDNSVVAQFELGGTLGKGSGTMIFTWDINGVGTKTGQRVTQRLRSGVYTLTMEARQQVGCPEVRPVRASVAITVGSGLPDVNLPLLLLRKPSTEAVTLAADAQILPPLVWPDEPPLPPSTLDVADQSGRPLLTWQHGAGPQAQEARIYRSADGGGIWEVETTLPASQTSYLAAQSCGVTYAVALANTAGESDFGPSFAALPCQEATP